MGRIIVVTGTDTEVGKTFVTAALAVALREAGHKVRAVKPVESGWASEVPGDGEDGVILARAAAQSSPSHALQRFNAPLAPPVAARLEDRTIDDDVWKPAVDELAAEADFVLVEGAGGLLSPLSDRFDALALAEHLGADVLVVACDKLGTINHARLTLAALEHAGFSRDLDADRTVVGFAFSAPPTPDESTGRNVAAFIEATGFDRVATVARHPDPPSAAPDVHTIVDWLRP